MAIDIVRGEHQNLAIVVRKNGAPLNLSGGVLYFIAKTDIGDPDAEAIITKDSTDTAEIEITNPAAGQATIKFIPADTLGLPVPLIAPLEYEIQLKDSLAEIHSIEINTMTVTPSVRETAL